MNPRLYSLQRRLLLGSTLATSLIMIGSGAVIYVSARRHLMRNLDGSLTTQAHYIAGLAEYDRDGLDLELEKLNLPRLREEGKWSFTIHSPDGEMLAEAGFAFGKPIATPTARDPAPPQTVQTAAGRRVRVLGLHYVPASEDGAEEFDANLFPRLNVAPGTPLLLTVARTMEDVDEALGDLLTLLVSLWVLATVVLVAVLACVVRRGIAPARALAGQIQAVDPTRTQQQIELTRIPRELEPVVRCLNGLLQRVDEAMSRERSFLAATAHELRTPIAALRTTLDVALLRPRGQEQYRLKLSQCHDLTLRLQTLINNLLYMARLDAGVVRPTREPVWLAEAIEACYAPLRAGLADRGLSWHCDVGADIRVLVAPQMLDMVLTNLLENALAHALSNGEINVAAARRGMTVSVALSNPAVVIAAEATAHVFERFWRSDTSRGLDRGHLGLGLTLCRELVQQMDGSIRAEVRDARFIIYVNLPAAPEDPSDTSGTPTVPSRPEQDPTP